MDAVHKELDDLTAHILASEQWAKRYAKTPKLHTQLIKTEARLERKVRGFFHDLSQQTDKLVRWNLYKQIVNAYSLDVMVDDNELGNSSQQFISIVFDELAIATALGAQSGDELYKYKLGLTTSDAAIQKSALEQAAKLVGKSVLPDGTIIDNVIGGLDITSKTRQDIRQSIHTSITLGENVKQAKERMMAVIDNPKRAELISRTEVVNSFGMGLSEYGRQTEAVGKEWQDTGADDICADNTAAGVIPFEDDFPSGDSEPTAHPNCRCSMRLVYQNELDANPDLMG